VKFCKWKEICWFRSKIWRISSELETEPKFLTRWSRSCKINSGACSAALQTMFVWYMEIIIMEVYKSLIIIMRHVLSNIKNNTSSCYLVHPSYLNITCWSPFLFGRFLEIITELGQLKKVILIYLLQITFMLQAYFHFDFGV
jgi:hypothetical protein